MSKPDKAATTGEPAAPAKTTPAQPEPTTADLGRIISKKKPTSLLPAAAGPGSVPRSAPSGANAGEDPDFPDDPAAPAAADPTAAIDPADEPAEPAQPAAAAEPAEPAEPAADPDPEPADNVPADLELDAEDLAARKGFTPEQQGRFDKAMRKARGKAGDLATKLEEAEQALEQLAAAPAVAALPSAEDPLADCEDEAALQKRVNESRVLWRWARLHPNGGTIKDAAGRDVEITPERALEIQVQEEELIQQHAPARAQFLKDRATQDAAAVQAHPWLKNKASRGAVEIEALLRRNPGLRSVPGVRLILADSLAGRATRLAKKTPTAPGARPAVPVAPATPAGRNPPPRTGGQQKTVQVAQKAVAETGRDPGNAALGALLTRRKQ